MCRIYSAGIGGAKAASCVIAGRGVQEVGLKLQLVNLRCEDAVLADSLGRRQDLLASIPDVDVRHRSCETTSN